MMVTGALILAVGRSHISEYDEDCVAAGGGLLAAGALVWLFSPTLAGRDSKRTQFQVAPNGCRFTYRF
jgi:hypothetical protein